MSIPNQAFNKILLKVSSPQNLKELSLEQLETLSSELREAIILNLSKTGGHLASNLGMIETTIALHYVFNSPTDKLIFDVGHQCYAHKLLTGRQNSFNTLRQYKGLSGFINPNESVHDAFLAGHSSTSISLGLGMSIARDILNEDHNIVIIIGDGGLTGGMALEALNHLGHIQKNVLIILNDNEMSISNNIGGIYHYMKRLKETFFYKDIKDKINLIETNLSVNHLNPNVLNLIHNVKEQASQRFETPGIVFEKLGINYYGPTDGHNLQAIIRELENIKDIKKPKLLHLITQKGKGFAPAEADAIKYHGVSSSFLNNLDSSKTDKIEPDYKPKTSTYSDIFAQTLIELAQIEPNMVALTPATAEGSGLVKFGNLYPKRFFDVAICEQHAVTCAAGMAKAGLKPIVSIYSTFLQRAIDQIIHDVAILNLNVLFCIDRAGLVEDGETHQGAFDISLLRTIPNLKILAPKDANELKDMIYTALASKQINGPIAIRYPRDKAYNFTTNSNNHEFKLIDFTKWEYLHKAKNHKVVVLATGSMIEQLEPGFKTNSHLTNYASLVNARCLKPLDHNLLKLLLNDHNIQTIVTVEEGALSGGFGSSVLEWYHNQENEIETYTANLPVKTRINFPRIVNIGLKDTFIEHGQRSILLDQNGLNSHKLIKRIEQLILSSFTKTPNSVEFLSQV